MRTTELEQSKKEITASDLDMVTFEGFQRRYLKHLETSRTNQDAYDATEKDYKAIFKVNRYSSFDSFRVVKNDKLKKKRS